MSTTKKVKIPHLDRKDGIPPKKATTSSTPQKHLIFKELLEENRITKSKIRAVETKIAVRLENERLKK